MKLINHFFVIAFNKDAVSHLVGLFNDTAPLISGNYPVNIWTLPPELIFGHWTKFTSV